MFTFILISESGLSKLAKIMIISNNSKIPQNSVKKLNGFIDF